MKVRELIKQLKEYPQNLDVHVSHGDNYEWESAGWVYGVNHFIKTEYIDKVENCVDYDSKRMFKDMPSECIILSC